MIVFPKPICKRLSDGSLWRASHPGYPTLGGYYFKGIKPVTFLCFSIWIGTGDVWEFEDPLEFEVLK